MSTAAERTRQYRARRYAEGWHYVNGRLTNAPRKHRRPGEEPPHGTRARYVWRVDPCRCDECRAASAHYARQRYHK